MPKKPTNRPKKHPGVPANLLHNRTDLTPEEITALRRKGAERTHEIMRERRTFREWALIIRDLPAKDPRCKGMTEGQAIIMKAYAEARRGNVQAIRFLAELAGEMVQKVEVHEPPKLIFDI